MSKEVKYSFADDEHTQFRNLGEQGASSIKGQWKKYKLSRVCTLINGRAYSKSELLYEGKYPVLRVGNFFTNNHWYYSDMELAPDKYCDDGDLLYAWSASFGPRIWTGGKVIFHYHIWKVLPNAELIDKRFLFFWFLWDADHIRADQGTGTTMMHVAKGSMEDRDIWLPSLSEQKRVVAILEEVFEGVERAQAVTRLNLGNSRALLDGTLQSLLERDAKACPVYLDSVCEISSMLIDPREPSYVDLPHVGAGNIESRTGVLADIQTAREEGLISGKFVFDETMVLYSKIRPYLEKAARPDFRGLCSADMYPLKPFHGKITRDFLFYILLSRSFTQYAIAGSARSGMPKVNRDHLFKYRFKLPSLAEQHRITEKLDSLKSETERLDGVYKQKHLNLEDLKQSLLQQAFSGNL